MYGRMYRQGGKMMARLIDMLGLINYGLVTVYGFLLSVAFSGGCSDAKQKRICAFLLAAFILFQIPCQFALGVEFAKKIYPLLVHIPLVLFLVIAMKRKIGVAVVSVCTAYSCCQFPRWISMAVSMLTSSSVAAVITYTISIVAIFVFLYRYFSKFVYTAMVYSKRTMVLFGTVPVTYYIFDYATAIYTNLLYSGGYAVAEALPTVCILFYVGFISLYNDEVQKRSRTEFEKSALAQELKQAETEMTAMRLIDEQNAVFRHDMRHHFNVISTFLENRDIDGAAKYIRQIREKISKVTPVFYTANNIVNITLSYFALKAKESGVSLDCRAEVPEKINIPDVDLSAVLSNTLENAVTAAAQCDSSVDKEVKAFIAVKKNKLLISVSNPYNGIITADAGLPVNTADGHGFGIKSINAIAGRYNGNCSFEWENNIFKARIVMSV